MCHNGWLKSSATHQVADHFAQLRIATRGRQRDVAEVVLHLEAFVDLPMRLVAPRAWPQYPLVKATEGFEAAAEQQPQPFAVHRSLEGQHPGDHHQVGGVFHAQPCGVDARHRNAFGHRPQC
jgi:hypothetical protein